MMEIKASSLSLFDLIQTPPILSLIQPSVLPFLSAPPHGGKWVIIEAKIKEELIGLSLSEVYRSSIHCFAQIHSLLVKPAFQDQGIEHQIFSFTQKWLIQEEKVYSLEMTYPQGSSSLLLEEILDSQKWLKRVFLIRFQFELSHFNPPWLFYPSRLPPSMEMFSWQHLLPKERIEIEYLSKQRRFFPTLNPLMEEEKIDLRTSVGLRQGENIVGWSITHRQNFDTICYAILYIDSLFLYQGYGIALVSESIRRQKALSIPYALFEINLDQIDPSWWRFIKKRLLPLAFKIEKINFAFYIPHQSK